MNPSFKHAQLLPAMTPEMFVAAGSRKTFCPLCARVETREVRRAAAPSVASRRLPRPQADRCRAELALLAMLTLSAAFCVGQAALTALELTPQWPLFEAWVVRLLS